MSCAASPIHLSSFLPNSFAEHGRRCVPTPRAPSASFPMCTFQSPAQTWTSIPSRRCECFITPDQGFLEKQVFQPGRFRPIRSTHRDHSPLDSRNSQTNSNHSASVPAFPSLVSSISPGLLCCRRQHNRRRLTHDHEELFQGDRGVTRIESSRVRRVHIAQEQDIQFFFAHQPQNFNCPCLVIDVRESPMPASHVDSGDPHAASSIIDQRSK